jgi:hypothetical protein
VTLSRTHFRRVTKCQAIERGGRLEEIFVIGVIMFVVLMPFFALKEIGRDIGDDKLFEQFLVRRTPAAIF